MDASGGTVSPRPPCRLPVDHRRLQPIEDQEVSLREVLVHMIEEYARHCGHADFLRERIDGRVGQ
jgi:Protein of unknown function (DUF664)